MNAAVVPALASPRAGLHGTLRFAAGVTAAFVACEWQQWTPTFLAPVLTAMLLANLPVRPSPKVTAMLFTVMAAAALSVFAASSLLRGVPVVLFGVVALCLFLSFLAMASGRPALPFMLLLICLATIPVMVIVAPASAGAFPIALAGGMALALLATWAVHLAWPVVAVPSPASAPAGGTGPGTALAMALLSTAVVMPLMLVYLLFGLADVLPVLVATVLLVVNFDLRRGRVQAMGMIVGNFLGGLLALLLHALLLTTPSLPFLALLLFMALLGFGRRITAGGPAAPVVLVTCNAMLIILGSAIASGPASFSLWVVRVSQFALAGLFAVGMMALVSRRLQAGVRSGGTTSAG